MQLFFIIDNEHFDPIYAHGYIFILVLYLGVVILACFYLFPRDSPESRATVPWTFMIAAIINALLVIWIIIYIGFLYEKDEVLIQSSGDGTPTEENQTSEKKPDKENPGYRKQNKALYIFVHILDPLTFSIVLFLFFFWSKEWVAKTENNQKATEE